jgi:hypothetical protein
MSRGSEMIEAWIAHMERAQPQYGPLLQSTVDEVGPLPAIDEGGAIRTIREDIKFWMAAGYAQAYAATLVDHKRINVMGGEYPKLREAGDEEGMVLARQKGKFYETLRDWIKSTEPMQLPMKQIPDWLAPFMKEK